MAMAQLFPGLLGRGAPSFAKRSAKALGVDSPVFFAWVSNAVVFLLGSTWQGQEHRSGRQEAGALHVHHDVIWGTHMGVFVRGTPRPFGAVFKGKPNRKHLSLGAVFLGDRKGPSNGCIETQGYSSRAAAYRPPPPLSLVTHSGGGNRVVRTSLYC